MDPLTSIDTPDSSGPPSLAAPEKTPPLPWRTRLTAAFAVAATLALLSWTALRLSGWSDAGPIQVLLKRPEASPLVPLLVDAAPWGQVRQIAGPGGVSYPPPQDAVTPVVLELAPGKYRIDLAGPPGTDPQSCEVELIEATPGRCRVSFAQLESIDYFRDAGWWQ